MLVVMCGFEKEKAIEGKLLTDTILLIPVIVLLAIRITFASEHDMGELAAARRRFGLVALRAVEVAVEDARIAFAT